MLRAGNPCRSIPAERVEGTTPDTFETADDTPWTRGGELAKQQKLMPGTVEVHGRVVYVPRARYLRYAQDIHYCRFRTVSYLPNIRGRVY